MEMEASAPYPTSPPPYSETMMTSPEPPPMPPPMHPPMHPHMHPHMPPPLPSNQYPLYQQYPPQYQPEPSSYDHNPPHHVPPWIPHQPIGNADTSFTETSTARQNASYQYNPRVVHVVADTEYNGGSKHRQGCCLSLCFVLIVFIIMIVIFFKVLVRV